MSKKYPHSPARFCDYTKTCWRSVAYSVGDLDYCRYHFARTRLPYPEEEPPDTDLFREQLVKALEMTQ